MAALSLSVAQTPYSCCTETFLLREGPSSVVANKCTFSEAHASTFILQGAIGPTPMTLNGSTIRDISAWLRLRALDWVLLVT